MRASSVRATQRMHERCGMCILRCRAAEVTETRTVRSSLEFGNAQYCMSLCGCVCGCVCVLVCVCVCLSVCVLWLVS